VFVEGQGSPMSLEWRHATPSLLLREDQAVKGSAGARIAAFDLNDTLVTSKSGLPGYQLTLSDWQYYNDRVVPKLRTLHGEGSKLVIFSNQGNIRAALNGKRAQSVKAYIDAFLKDVDVPVQVFLATQNDRFRKPSVGMWEYLEQQGNGGIVVDRAQSFYVGDAAGGLGEHSAADSEFAQALGVKFIHVQDYFGPAGETALHGASGVGLKRPAELLGAGPSKAPRLAGNLSMSDSDELHAGTWPVHFAGGRLVPPVVLVLVGAPGSGKSTFASRLAPAAPAATRRASAGKSTGAPGSLQLASPWKRVCQDILKSKEACLRSARACLEQGLSVVIDRTNVDADQRSLWLELARQTGAACHCLVLDVPAAECCRRVVKRPTHEGGLVGPGGQHVVMRLFGQLRPVRTSEGFQRVRLVRHESDIHEELRHYGNARDVSEGSRDQVCGSVEMQEPALSSRRADCAGEQDAAGVRVLAAGQAGARSPQDANVQSLMALGFGETASEAALRAAAGDVNRAAHRLLEDKTRASPKLQEPVLPGRSADCTDQRGAADLSVHADSADACCVKDASVQSLMALGFGETACKDALRVAAGDVNRAAHGLLGDRLFGD